MASKDGSEQDSPSDNDKAGSTGPPYPTDEDVKNLKGNFEQQQAMIGQLRDRLKQKERQQEVEDYAARLAKMKPRLLRGAGRGRSKEREDASPRTSAKVPLKETSMGVFDEAMISEVIPVKEEVKAAVESASDLAPSDEKLIQQIPSQMHSSIPQAPIASQETGSRAKILLLRKQLEDNRIKFERQQRENADKKATMDDMKDRIQQLRAEVEHRDTVIQSLQEVDSLQINDPNIQHLYRQILQKDNALLDQVDKIKHLETLVQDQNEQLEEKDKIISARTEAVSLVTKDRDEKLMKTMQELEEIRLSMRQMQQLFADKEDSWQSREKSLSIEIEEKNKKIIVLEENCGRIESIRFELSVRNAELQEKIVNMQSESKDLREELSNSKYLINKQNNEMIEAKRKLVRAEAFGQKKLKALEKQTRTLSNDSDFSDRILQLLNQIAELEDEKGNLQLKLVDFDEMKSQMEKLHSSVKSSEDKIDQINAELFLQIGALNQIQQENISLVDQLNAKSVAFNLLEEQSQKYLFQYEEIKQSKVILELRICALEEERDIAVKSHSVLESEHTNMDLTSLEELKSKSDRLEETIKEMQKEINQKNSQLQEMEEIAKEKEKLALMAVEEKDNKLSENECLISILAEKETALSTQSIETDKHHSLVEKLYQEISNYEESIKDKDKQIFQFEEKIKSFHKTISDLELNIESLNKTIFNLESEVSSNRDLINKVNEAERSLSLVLVEKEKAILILEGEICSLDGELRKSEALVSNQLEKLQSLEKNLDVKVGELKNLEINFSSKSDECMQQRLICQKQEQDIFNIQQCLKETESKLTAECETISCLLADRDNQIESLEQQFNVKVKELQNSQLMMSKFEVELCEKNRYFNNLIKEKDSLVSSLQCQVSELYSTMENNSSEICHLKNLITQKETLISQLQDDKYIESEKLLQQEESFKTQSERVMKLESEINDLQSSFAAKKESFLQLQKEYRTLASDLEMEVSQKKLIMESNNAKINQLMESLSSTCAESSFQKEQIEKLKKELNEKAGYIFAVEQQLDEKESEMKQQEEVKDHYLSEVQLEFSNSLTDLQTKNQELNLCLEETHKNENELQMKIQSVNSENQELDDQLRKLQQAIESKNLLIENLQTSFSASNENKDESQQTIMGLQSQLYESTEQYNQMEVYYKALMSDALEEKQKYEDVLKAKSDEWQQELSKLQFENETVIKDLQNRLKEAQSSVLELQRLKENNAMELKSYNEKIIILQEKLNNQALQPNNNEHQNRFGELPTVTNDELSTVQKLNELLKNQLEEAQQHITRLETILATQSDLSDVKQKSADDWGDVDLGEPSFYVSNTSMQTSLIEKDKTLTVIQEQLKNALEQINTVNDEKKLVQHQMNTLEAKLTHDEQNMISLKKQIYDLEVQNSSLSQQLQEMQDSSHSQQFQEMQDSSHSQQLHEMQDSSLSQQLQEMQDSSLSQQLQEMQDSSLRHQPKQMQVFNSSLHNHLQSLKEQIHDLNMKNSSLSQQLQEMKFSNASLLNQLQLNSRTGESSTESVSITETFLHPSVNENMKCNAENVSMPVTWFKPSTRSVNTESDNIFIVDSNLTSSEYQQEIAKKESTPDIEQLQFQVMTPNPELEGQNTEVLLDLQYKLSWYEENWTKWTEYYNQLQASYQIAQQEIIELNQLLETNKHSLNVGSSQTAEVKVTSESAEEEQQRTTSPEVSEEPNVTYFEDSLRKDYEMQIYELQTQVNNLQLKCSSLSSKVNEAENDAAKLHEYKILYGELQTSMQESEIKCEGSKSRVQELELMVQSAESEISRLRTDLQTISTAGKVLENEKSCLQAEFDNLKEELRKNIAERERFEEENDRLQKEASSLSSQVVDLQNLMQRRECEGEQLRSEVEMLQGENDRMRSNFEIVESENNRLRNDVDFLTQSNQMLTAQKESLEIEIQRLEIHAQSLSSERDHFRGEMQRLNELSTSAESEISRLKQEGINLSAMSSHYHELERRYTELQSIMQTEISECKQPSQELQLEEVDWGTDAKIEDEHLQRSSSIERVLQEELDHIKLKIIELEKEKNSISDELQSSKLKNGKMIQKLKAANNKNGCLRKDLEKLKNQAGGFSDLDQAMENEYKAQVTKAEKEKDEIKIKLDELEKEKEQMNNKIDVLENAHEKYIEMKELQDASLRHLSVANKNLESQVATLEWKISEMEETFEEEKRSLLSDREPHNANLLQSSQTININEVQLLRQNSFDLERKISDLTKENCELKGNIAELDTKLEDLSTDNEGLQVLLNNLRDAKNKAESDINGYKSSFLEIHSQLSCLQETNKQTEDDLKQVNQQQSTLRAAYDVLYEDYHQLQDERDSFKYELGILTGKKEKLQEEVQSLNNQLEALKEEEEEEIIRALQDECSELREQNNLLKDEIIRLGEVTKLAEESTDRTKHTLDQQVEIQELLRADFLAKSDMSEQQRVKLEEREREIKYLNAEIASLKMKSLQQQQALEEMEPKILEMRDMLQNSQEQNQRLKEQVEIADSSLTKMATGRSSSDFFDQQQSRSLSVAAESELEAALTSLHLRDLRCQQLSLEINKLLEERDALQLKLSASLRQNQELSRELNQSQQLPNPTTPPPSLSEKLAELRNLNSGLEKKALNTLGGVGSTYGPQFPTMPTFVSHTAPATPTATRYSDHTVSRVSQGSPATIMDWILGKSTPKEILHV